MTESDQTVDEAARIDLIHQIGQFLVDDHVMLPLYQFPNIAAWRTDRLEGPIDADAGNYRAFSNNMFDWEPVGDSEIIIGAEQWPECLNPITECANSSWYVWTTAFQVLPACVRHHRRGRLRDHRPPHRGAGGRDRRRLIYPVIPFVVAAGVSPAAATGISR